MHTSALAATVDTAAIKEIILEHIGKKVDAASLQVDTDLYLLGLTSLATVGLMLALEEHFDVEFPESMLGRATFRSIASIADSINKLSK
jgi:acyl carrier protein